MDADRANDGTDAQPSHSDVILWFDVEDLFHYVQHSHRLSGVQRLSFELYRAMEAVVQQEPGVRTGYVRIDPVTGRFIVVAWEDVLALCLRLTVAHDRLPQQLVAVVPEPPVSPPGPRTTVSRRFGTSVARRLPETARPFFHRFCILQMGSLRALRSLLRETLGVQPVRELTAAPSLAPSPQTETHVSAQEPAAAASTGSSNTDVSDRLPPSAIGWLDQMAGPDDWMLSFGASWHRSDYGVLLHRLRARCPLRMSLLVYDLIPLRRPEWCHHTLVEEFGLWLHEVVPQADALFAISQSTAADLKDFLNGTDSRSDRPIGLLPVGSGFADDMSHDGDVALPVRTVSGPYVLFVSTIEARKNHLLLVQVWRWLLEQRPAEQVPTLVFAGRIGWLVEDLIEQLSNTNYLNGKVRIVEDPSDAVLNDLYAGCLFTLFPSLFEGWGLPVTESLAHGQPCLISNTTSLPEAGGTLARYFDPTDLRSTCSIVLDVLDDPEGLALWKADIKRDFRPVLWTESARSLLHSLAAAASG